MREVLSKIVLGVMLGILVAPRAVAEPVDLPGTIGGGVQYCKDAASLGFGLEPIRHACIVTPNDRETPVRVLDIRMSYTSVLVEGQVRFAHTSHVVVEYMNVRLSAESYLVRAFPPGIKGPETVARTVPQAGMFGHWNAGGGQGVAEYWTENTDGSRFMLTCDGNAGLGHPAHPNHAGWSVDGIHTPKNSSITVAIDGRTYQLFTDDAGDATTKSRIVADNYIALWAALRKGSEAIVTAQNGKSVAFSLEGSGKALPAAPCTPDHYFKASQQATTAAPSPNTPSSGQDEIISELKRICREKWGTDYEMIEYCQGKQMKALVNLGGLLESFSKGSAQRDILNRCLDKWEKGKGSDWETVEYCYGRQLGAYQRLKAQ